MQITVTTAKSGKINIFADGEYRFSVPAEVWFSQPLRDSDETNEEELHELKKTGSSFLAYESALRMLSLRAHSQKELETKLRAKFGAEAARSAVERCKAAELIDDEKFARLFAGELYEHKHFAPARIKNELFSRGISADIAESVLASMDFDSSYNISAAYAKLHMPDNPSEKEIARAYRRLISMGFSYEEIRTVLITSGKE